MRIHHCCLALALAVAAAAGDGRGSFATTVLPRTGPQDAPIQDLLALYATPAGRADYQMTCVSSNPPVSEVSFLSPFTSPHGENNAVWCRYYQAAAPGRHPAVIMLHHAEGANVLEDFISRKLAADGVPALLVQLPYYGKRRPADPALRDVMKQVDLEMAIKIVRQGILDVHRAKDWLRSRPEVDGARVSVAGISLGALAAATAAGVDPDFWRVALVLGGGDVTGILSSDLPGVKRTRDGYLKKAGSVDEMRERLRCAEPLTFARRIPRGTVMMINAKQDDHIPVGCTMKLWKALGEPPIHWYDTTHVGAAVHLFDIVDILSAFLGGQSEGSTLTSILREMGGGGK
ncbi:MAG: dienelactone hydrolase family protein [Verrucomicrobia bacterium]|nr:dienelactone hydrolase family protein [Verrucomicrobiota bacterium]